MMLRIAGTVTAAGAAAALTRLGRSAAETAVRLPAQKIVIAINNIAKRFIVHLTGNMPSDTLLINILYLSF
jgi:hypothetical protein